MKSPTSRRAMWPLGSRRAASPRIVSQPIAGRRAPLSGRALFNRRRFLQCAGASALTLPFLKALPGYAQDVSDKRYLLLLFTPNGVVRHLWGMDKIGESNTDVELRPWLQPLERYKHMMSCVVGLENKGTKGGTHEASLKTLWTGVDGDGSQTFGAGTSIDQAIASQMQTGTAYESLHFRAVSPQDFTGANVENRMIHRDGVPVDPFEEPFDAFDALFQNFVPPEPTMPTPVAEPMIDQRTVNRQKLFTHLDTELARLKPRLCAEDAVHLDALRGAWSNLADRLGPSSGASASTECARPDVNDIEAPSEYPFVVLQNIELLTMSLACDFTRVASLQFSSARSPMVPDWLGIDQEHHDISHSVPGAEGLGPGGFVEPDPDNPTPEQLATHQVSIERSTQINLYYAEQIALLMDRLNSIPLASGKTLLDQCTICWGNELDNGNSHNHHNMPFTLLGGGAGRLRGNQLVEFPVLAPNVQASNGERSHNDLLVTLAQIMGVNLQTFGKEEYNTAPIPELIL